eukprot:UN12272
MEILFQVFGLIFTLLLLFAGFYIPPDSIPDGWVWMYWFNHVRYTLQAGLRNEFDRVGDIEGYNNGAGIYENGDSVLEP